MTRTFEIVENIVEKMDLSIKVKSILDDKLTVCKTLHIRIGSIVKDSHNQSYRVTEFENNKSITVYPLGNYTFEDTIVFAPKPVFLQGKWVSANNEYLLMDSDTRKKTPLIWLVRGYEEKHGGVMDAVKLDVEPLIFFLDEADFDNWINEDHDREAINPMYNLASLFIETVEKDATIKTLENWKISDEPRFGVKFKTQNKEKGNEARILSDDLSGVGLKIHLKVFLDECKC